jgi:hypothetical protein
MTDSVVFELAPKYDVKLAVPRDFVEGYATCEDARCETEVIEGVIRPVMNLGLFSRGTNNFSVDFGASNFVNVMDMMTQTFAGNLQHARELAVRCASFVVPDPIVSKTTEPLSSHVSDLEHAFFRENSEPLTLVNPSFGTVYRAISHGTICEVAIVKRPDFLHEQAAKRCLEATHRGQRAIPILFYESWEELNKKNGQFYEGFNYSGRLDRSRGFQINPYHETLLSTNVVSVLETDDYVDLTYRKKDYVRQERIDAIVSYSRYNWDIYASRYGTMLRDPVSPFIGAYRYCSTKLEHFTSIGNVTPAPIGACLIDVRVHYTPSGIVYVSDDGMDVVDYVSNLEWGSRQARLPELPKCGYIRAKIMIPRATTLVQLVSRSELKLVIGELISVYSEGIKVSPDFLDLCPRECSVKLRCHDGERILWLTREHYIMVEKLSAATIVSCLVHEVGEMVFGLISDCGLFHKVGDSTTRFQMGAVVNPYCRPLGLLDAFHTFAGTMARCYLHADLGSLYRGGTGPMIEVEV